VFGIEVSVPSVPGSIPADEDDIERKIVEELHPILSG
jgi:hypothetical protein